MTFEQLLSRRIATVMTLSVVSGVALSGCKKASVQQYCDATHDSGDKWVVDRGYVKVDVGEKCPTLEEAELRHTSCCPDMTYLGATCSFEEKQPNQIENNTINGPSFGDAPAGTEGDFDLCWYEGVFEPGNICCGRPLLGADGPVLAAVERGSQWTGTPEARTDGVGPDVLRAAAAHWLESALLEHASVASFARFSLELMQFGAPPALLTGAHIAAQQEVRHAELCFALASAYAGRPLAPGPLEIGAANALSSWADFAEAVAREGCIGEAMAAVEAAARLAHTTDPAVRQVLDVIVRDESEHASLAWRTLRWILENDPTGAARARLDHVFAEQAEHWSVVGPVVATRPSFQAHGLLSPSKRAAVMADAWVTVIAPAWQALSAG